MEFLNAIRTYFQSLSVGWLAAVTCLFITIRCAFVFARREPKLFLALTVYAAQWGVLIVYYSGPDKRNELLPALSGYLCAIVGSIIYRSHQRSGGPQNLFPHETIVAYLLLLLALPEVLQTPNQASLLPAAISHQDIEVAVTVLLDAFGFYSMGMAVKSATVGRSHAYATYASFAIYWLLDASFTGWWLYGRIVLHIEEPPMRPFHVYAFAIIKILTTLIFVSAVVSPYSPFKHASWLKRIFLFLHIPY